MRKILYLPFAIVGSILARLLGRSLFNAVWARIDDEPVPNPGAGTDGMVKVVGSRALRSAVTAGSSAAVDHLLARAFHHLLGIWPKKAPKAK